MVAQVETSRKAFAECLQWVESGHWTSSACRREWGERNSSLFHLNVLPDLAANVGIQENELTGAVGIAYSNSGARWTCSPKAGGRYSDHTSYRHMRGLNW